MLIIDKLSEKDDINRRINIIEKQVRTIAFIYFIAGEAPR
jgi:hypothetical protein